MSQRAQHLSCDESNYRVTYEPIAYAESSCHALQRAAHRCNNVMMNYHHTHGEPDKGAKGRHCKRLMFQANTGITEAQHCSCGSIRQSKACCGEANTWSIRAYGSQMPAIKFRSVRLVWVTGAASSTRSLRLLPVPAIWSPCPIGTAPTVTACNSNAPGW